MMNGGGDAMIGTQGEARNTVDLRACARKQRSHSLFSAAAALQEEKTKMVTRGTDVAAAGAGAMHLAS